MPTLTAPAIRLSAVLATPEKVFVKVPNERARWMLTDRCVVEVGCRHCGAAVGEPCYRVRALDVRRYAVGTHFVRRDDYQSKYGSGYSQSNLRNVKPRVTADDLRPGYDPDGPLDDDMEC